MVMLTGVSIGQIGLKLLFHATDGSGASNIDLTAAAFTLFVMVFCHIWLKSRLRLFAALFGLLAGSLLAGRSEEHTSELQSLMRISYAVFCLKKKITKI